MYILQFCDAFNRRILRQKSYKKTDIIESIITALDRDYETFIVDSQLRVLEAKCSNYIVYDQGDDKIYKVFFNVKSSQKPNHRKQGI